MDQPPRRARVVSVKPGILRESHTQPPPAKKSGNRLIVVAVVAAVLAALALGVCVFTAAVALILRTPSVPTNAVPPPVVAPAPPPVVAPVPTPTPPAVVAERPLDAADFQSLVSEAYPEPKRLRSTKSNYAKIYSPAGGDGGGPLSHSFDMTHAKFGTMQREPSYVMLEFGDWRATFAPPRGDPKLATGKYLGAVSPALRARVGPGLVIHDVNRGSRWGSGSFMIWEYEVIGGRVEAFAADFVEGSGPAAVCGRIRYRSKYE